MPQKVSPLRSALTALAAALLVAAPASAGWEPTQRIDNQGEGFASVMAGDLAAGAAGDATIFFSQRRDGTTAAPPYALRRGAAEGSWSAPAAVALPGGVTGAFRIALGAAPDGSARGAFGTGTRIFGLRWDAGASPSATDSPVLTGVSANDTAPARIAVDASGAAYLLHASQGNIKFAEFSPGSGWGAEQTLGQGSEAALAVNAGGDVAVAYTTGSGTAERIVLRRRLAGGSFTSEAAGAVPSPGRANQPSVAVGADRVATLVFRSYPAQSGSPTRIATARLLPDVDSPGSVSDVSRTSSPEQFGPANESPEVVVDPSNRITVAWQAKPQPAPNNGSNVMSSQRLSSGYSAPLTVSTGSTFDLDVDADGTATIVYQDGAVLRASRRAAGAAWTDKTSLSPAAGGSGPTTSIRPRVVASGPGRADAFFLHDFDSASNAELNRAYATRFTGPPPVGPPVVEEAEGCPLGLNKLSGSEGNDTIHGTSLADAIIGRGGDDRIGGGPASDCIRAGAGDDDAGGEDGNDSLFGEDGNDKLRGGSGLDTLLGGSGNDAITGGTGADRLAGEDGDDRLSGGAGRDLLEAGPGADRVFGGGSNDFASGGDGDDVMSGGSGNDSMLGEGGNDRMSSGGGRRDDLRGGDGDDRLRGASGRDLLIGDAGADRLFGLSGRDLLIGGDDDDLLSGGSGNDRLYGRAGDDRLRGGTGNDLIKGGLGDDRIWGDGGRDQIRGNSGDDVIHAADGRVDTINCGGGKDRVIADRFDRVARNCERVTIRTRKG